MVSKTNSENKKRERSNVLSFPNRFSKGREKITERRERILEEFAQIQNEVADIGRTALTVLNADDDMLKDKVKSKRIAYSLLYTKNIVERFMERMEKVGDENDMETFISIIKSPAFSEMLVMACEESRKGKDDRIKDRYELITGEDGLAELARKYNIKIKNYSKISKEDAGVDEIEKAKPVLSGLPKSVSRKTAIKVLTEFLKKGWDSDLEKLMKIPQELYVKKGEGYFIFTEKEESKATKMIKTFFGGVGTKLVDLKAGWALVIQESGSHTYASFIDTSRRIAVKTPIFSMHEEKRGWEEFKKGLKDSLKSAKKISKTDKKTFVVYDIDMLKKYNLSKVIV